MFAMTECIDNTDEFDNRASIASLFSSEFCTNTGFRAWNRCHGFDLMSSAFLKHKNSEEYCFVVEKYHGYLTPKAKQQLACRMLSKSN